MTTIVNLQTHAEHFVTVAELAAYWCVSEKTVYRDIDKGALPVWRLPSGMIRIPIEVARQYGKPEE